ncbi:TPA: DUF551 domain-containing protein [Serratia marcescens]
MTRTLTTEQLRARAESLGLDFFIEKRAGIWVKEWNTGACVTANAQEVEMWLLLANREAQPVAWRHDDGPFAGIAITRAKSVADSWIAKGWTVTPLYTAPPAPAVNASPDFEAWFVEKYKQPERLVKNEDSTYKFAGVQMAFSSWVDGRAAMLAQPVSGGYTLPEGWIACSEQMPEVGERDWRTALPVLVKCEIGVIPAYYGFTYHEGEQCFGFMESIKFGDGSGSGPEQYENRLMMHVTHWMPLPAAPEGGN